MAAGVLVVGSSTFDRLSLHARASGGRKSTNPPRALQRRSSPLAARTRAWRCGRLEPRQTGESLLGHPVPEAANSQHVTHATHCSPELRSRAPYEQDEATVP